MNTKSKVITNFSRESQAGFLHLTGEIIVKMTENASYFPNLPVPLAELTKERDAYQKVFDSEPSKARTADLHAARVVLGESLQKNGKYVNDLADGNETILARSGYPLAKGRAPVGDLPAPAWLRVVTLSGGGFSFDVAHVPHYWGYQIAYTEASNAEKRPEKWTILWSPAPKAEFSNGFVSGVKYKFAACAVASSFRLAWVHGSEDLFSQ